MQQKEIRNSRNISQRDL